MNVIAVTTIAQYQKESPIPFGNTNDGASMIVTCDARGAVQSPGTFSSPDFAGEDNIFAE